MKNVSVLLEIVEFTNYATPSRLSKEKWECLLKTLRSF